MYFTESNLCGLMRVPKKVICEIGDAKDNFICQCGDSIINDDGEPCIWANEVLEWQDIQPVYLKGRR